MTEFDLIERFFNREPARHAELGIGDDGALLGATATGRAVVCDTLVAGRHFFEDVAPSSLGHKALAVNLSDLAAMGAKPESFLLALTLPTLNESWLDAFSSGLFTLARRFDCELIGGDTTRGPLTITITAIGQIDAQVALRRDAAEPGDDLWVSGELGAAAIAVQVRNGMQEWPAPVQQRWAGLPADHRQQIDDALHWPQPRVELGMALRHFARAAIDISDGLLGDLAHLASRSRVGIQIRADQVPVAKRVAELDPALALQAALNGGDDYELAFTAAPENRPALERIGLQLGLDLTRIGQVSVGQEVMVSDARGRPVATTRVSHDHFKSACSLES